MDSPAERVWFPDSPAKREWFPDFLQIGRLLQRVLDPDPPAERVSWGLVSGISCREPDSSAERVWFPDSQMMFLGGTYRGFPIAE